MIEKLATYTHTQVKDIERVEASILFMIYPSASLTSRKTHQTPKIGYIWFTIMTDQVPAMIKRKR